MRKKFNAQLLLHDTYFYFILSEFYMKTNVVSKQNCILFSTLKNINIRYKIIQKLIIYNININFLILKL